MSRGDRSQSYLLAVDIGGTKTACALVTREGVILDQLQAPTSQEGPQAGIAQIHALLQELLRRSDLDKTAVQAIGVGIPAVLARHSDQVIWAPNLPGWRDVPLRESLQALSRLPVFVEYDGHTAVLGEWWAGAGRGFDSCVDIIIGTGIGGGMILDGRLVRGGDRLAGAAGWFAMTPAADQAHEGQRQIGHWESQAAGPGIAARAASRLADYPDSILARSIRPLTAHAIFNAARQGDKLAAAIIEDTASIIGVGIANIVSLVNPQIVILGGSIGSQGDLLLPGVRRAVKALAQPISASSVTIESSKLATDAGLFGAAYAALLRSEEQDHALEHALEPESTGRRTAQKRR